MVRLVGGLIEPEAEMWREVLANRGILAMVKNMSALSYAWGRATLPAANHFDLFVKHSDLTRARAILGPMLDLEPPPDEEA